MPSRAGPSHCSSSARWRVDDARLGVAPRVSMRTTTAYGWVIVAVGIVVTCVGFGAMATLTVFLVPMADAMGWSRTGISTAALVNWLCMGAGAFVWGALSDRFGTRLVVLI